MKKRHSVLWLLLTLGIWVQLQNVTKFLDSSGQRTDLEILHQAGSRFDAGQSVYVASDPYEHPKPPLLSPILAYISRIPLQKAKLAWNLLNLMLPICLMLYWRRLYLRSPNSLTFTFWAAAAFALLIMRADWREEINQGQYNLFLLGLLFLSHRLLHERKPILSGALATLGCLLKPSQVFSLVWMLPRNSMVLLNWAIGVLLMTLALSGLYWSFGPPADLIEDHLAWLTFLSEVSIPRHILRVDNFGIPALMARHGLWWPNSSLWIPVWVSVLYWIQKRVKFNERIYFHLIAWVAIALSPLTWRQNFTLLLPLALDLSFLTLTHYSIPGSSHKQVAVLGAGGLLALIFARSFNPGWLGNAFSQSWGNAAIPLWLTLIATLMGTSAIRRAQA